MNALNQQVSEALNGQQPELTEQMVAREYIRHPELEHRYGKAGREKCLQDAGCHLSFLAEAIAADDPGLFRDYIGWAKVMLAKRGVPPTDLKGLLESMKESLWAELPPETSRLACDYLDMALGELPQLPDEIPSFITEESPLAALAGQFLAALLQGEKKIASKLILDAVGQGVAVRDVYRFVFQRSMYEIGRLWQTNKISVAQEHYCTAATQLIMSQLYPYIFAGDKTAGTLVATCVAGELHEIGARMLADFFEMEGWRTYYLGANMPAASVVRMLVEVNAAVLGVSATIAYHVRAVANLIAAVRSSADCRGVKVLVGGYPFKVAPSLWETIGADGFARDADEAVALAKRLTSLNSTS